MTDGSSWNKPSRPTSQNEKLHVGWDDSRPEQKNSLHHTLRKMTWRSWMSILKTQRIQGDFFYTVALITVKIGFVMCLHDHISVMSSYINTNTHTLCILSDTMDYCMIYLYPPRLCSICRIFVCGIHAHTIPPYHVKLQVSTFKRNNKQSSLSLSHWFSLGKVLII